MTSSVTPIPAIHHIPALDSGAWVLPDWAQLQAWGNTLVTQIEQAIAFALLNVSVLGVKPFVALQTFGSEALGAVSQLEQLIAGIGGAAMADVVALLNEIQQLIDALANGFGLSGTGHTVPDIQTYLAGQAAFVSGWVSALAEAGVSAPVQFVQLLRGLIPAALPQFNGTWAPTGVPGFTDNLNGTISFVVGEAETDVAQLVQQADGTIITASQVVQHVANGASQAGAAVGQAVAAGQAVADGIVQAAAADATLVAQAAGTAQANLSTLFNNFAIHLGFGPLPGQGGADTALAGTAASILSAQARANAVAAALNTSGSVGGTDVTVDFSTLADAPTLAGIASPGSGPTGITSGEMTWQGTGTGDDLEVFTTPTTSDYQVIEVTLGALNDLAFLGDELLNINARINSTKNSYVNFVLFGNVSGGVPVYDVNVNAVVSGTSHSIAAQLMPALAAGGVIRIILGDKSAGNPYVMEIVYNNSVVGGPFTDSSHVSLIGSGQRFVSIEQVSSFSGKKPPSVRKIRYYDNAPSTGNTPFAGLPASNPSIPGGLYFCSDTGLVLRDNGGGWDRVQGGPLTAFTAPPSTGWTAVNQLTSTFAADKDSMLLSAPAVSGDQLTGLFRTLIPASGYAATFYIERLGAVNNSNWASGIALRDSSSGKIVVFGFGYSSGDDTAGLVGKAQKWNSATSFSGNYSTNAVRWLSECGIPRWVRCRDDGATRYFEYSYNGVDWATWYSVGRTDFITPDQIGVYVENQNNAMTLRLRSLAGVS